MTLRKIIEIGLVEDDTKIYIRGYGDIPALLTCGNWFQDNVLDYMDREVASFTWQDDKKIYIVMKL